MSIIKSFPEFDATIYSSNPNKNTGLDEIIELGNYKSILGKNETSRILIKFDTNEILQFIQSNPTYSVDLNLKLAYSTNLPLDLSIECFPLAQSWNMGTGRLSNVPETTDGVSWVYRNSKGVNSWDTNYTNGITGSYSGSIGGGTWISSSNNISLKCTSSISYTSNKDLKIPITNIIKGYDNYYNNKGTYSFPNNGIIIKLEDNIEFNDNYIELKYFSMDTHTIYPPHLDLKSVDQTTYESGSIINNNDFNIKIENNVSEFDKNSTNKFRVNILEKYPIRTFSTSSIYKNNFLLPTSSYWSLIDNNNNEIIFDFDDSTLISSDEKGNYFTLNMKGLQPERFYNFKFKYIFQNQTSIIDSDYYFKIKN